MVKENKRKQVHYRRASFLKPVGYPLQHLVEQALAKCTPVTNRFQIVSSSGNEDDTFRMFINTKRAALGMQFGNLVLYSPAQNRHIIAIDNAADEFDIEQIAPPNSGDGKNREFLESLLYYGIKNNHIILLQSTALKARDLEIHLNWLLRQAGVLDKENAVFLNNYAPPATYQNLDKAEVKSVRIGTPLVDIGVPSDASSAATPGNSKSVRFKSFGEGWDILRQIAPERIKEMSAEELSASSNLEVFVEVTYHRQTDEASQKLLNRLTTALRHSGDEDIQIELKGGGRIIGSDLQIKGFKQITAYNGLLEPESVFMSMHEWLLELLERELIDLD